MTTDLVRTLFLACLLVSPAIKLASGFEAATQVRAHNLSTFAPSAPFTNVQGTTLTAPHRHAVPPPIANAKKVPHHL